MTKRESLIRYSLILNKIQKGSTTFHEISQYLNRESELRDYDLRISKRTFQRDLEEIRSLFNVDIQFDRSKKVYSINEESDSSSSSRMLEAFNTFNLLNLADNLSNYIQFENRNASGSAYFYGLLHAVKNHLIIKIKYLKYEMDEISNRELEPYLLKEFKNRWYIIATDKKDNITKTFALDRIQDLEITRRKFELTSNFSHFELFQNCFGIISPNDGQPEEIVLSFEPHQGKYIKSCPIHISQEVVVNNNAETRIKLHLYVTHDLVMELLSYGETMKVIKPKRLIKIIRESARKTLNNHR